MRRAAMGRAHQTERKLLLRRSMVEYDCPVAAITATRLTIEREQIRESFKILPRAIKASVLSIKLVYDQELPKKIYNTLKDGYRLRLTSAKLASLVC